jgi:hypothetical protein
VAHQDHDYACHERTGRQRDKAEGCFASRILDPADGIGADKATEIADRIYQGNAAGGGGAGEKASRRARRSSGSSQAAFIGLP